MRLPPPVPARAAALIAALGAPAALAQDPAATVVEEVTVNVVNIDVHVTDRRGRPVSDLSVEDFEIFEEGEPMAITNFLNAASRADREDLEWTEGDELEELDAPDPPLMVALYIDRYRTHLGNLRRIESDLAAFLTSRREQARGIRFLFATGDPDLNVRVPFTTDPGELMDALEELEAEPRSPAVDTELFRQRILGEIREAYEACALGETASAFAPDCEPCQEMWPGFLGSANQYAAEMQSRSAASMSALGELVTALGGLPGPKAVIYVSDGLPQRPGAEMYQYLGEVCPEREIEMERGADRAGRHDPLQPLQRLQQREPGHALSGGRRRPARLLVRRRPLRRTRRRGGRRRRGRPRARQRARAEQPERPAAGSTTSRRR